MKRRGLTVGIIVVVGWLGVSIAHEQHAKHLPDSKDVIAFRTYLMENIGDNAKEINDKIKAGKIKDAKVNAQAIALHSTRVTEFFPKGSTSETSRAKDEIWQKWDDFVKASDEFRVNVDALGAAAADNNTEEAKAQLKKVLASCKSCHTSFRKPDKDEQKN
jgi:cytochrome c556